MLLMYTTVSSMQRRRSRSRIHRTSQYNY